MFSSRSVRRKAAEQRTKAQHQKKEPQGSFLL